MTNSPAARTVRGPGLTTSTPVWIVSIFLAGIPLSTSARRTASETAMIPWHVQVYFRRCTQGCLGSNATCRVTTRRTGAHNVARNAMFCACPLWAWTISALRNPSFSVGKPSACARSARALAGGQTMVCSRPRARNPRASFSRDSCPPRQVSAESTWIMVSGRRKIRYFWG
jgi:hypothetical protein